MKKRIPKILKSHILPFNWDVKLVWQLPAHPQVVERREFDYLLELPLWSSTPKSGMFFDISPMEILENPSLAPHQFERIIEADTSFPIDMMEYNNSKWILDGVHRLAKMYQNDTKKIYVRFHTYEVVSAIKTD